MSNKKAQRAKALQNYEQYPPRCNNCVNFRRDQPASPELIVDGVVMAPALQWIPSHCTIGSFACSPHGICDEWEHKVTGERLIPTKDEAPVQIRTQP